MELTPLRLFAQLDEMLMFFVLIQDDLLCTAAHLVDILVKRLSSQLYSFRHGWKDVDRINNVIYGELELDNQSAFMDHISCQ